MTLLPFVVVAFLAVAVVLVVAGCWAMASLHWDDRRIAYLLVGGFTSLACAVLTLLVGITLHLSNVGAVT